MTPGFSNWLAWLSFYHMLKHQEPASGISPPQLLGSCFNNVWSTLSFKHWSWNHTPWDEGGLPMISWKKESWNQSFYEDVGTPCKWPVYTWKMGWLSCPPSISLKSNNEPSIELLPLGKLFSEHPPLRCGYDRGRGRDFRICFAWKENGMPCAETKPWHALCQKSWNVCLMMVQRHP